LAMGSARGRHCTMCSAAGRWADQLTPHRTRAAELALLVAAETAVEATVAVAGVAAVVVMIPPGPDLEYSLEFLDSAESMLRVAQKLSGFRV
jgi:hypothetical protein